VYKIIKRQAFDALSAFLKRILAFKTSTIGDAESQQLKADVKELQHQPTVSSNWVASQHTC